MPSSTLSLERSITPTTLPVLVGHADAAARGGATAMDVFLLPPVDGSAWRPIGTIVAATYVASLGALLGAYAHGFTTSPKELALAATTGLAARLAPKTMRWQHHVLNPAASVDVDALTETVEATLDIIGESGPAALSLVGLRPEAVQGEHLATLLRASSTWRDQIPGWADALAVDIEALRKAGVEPKDALFGMI